MPTKEISQFWQETRAQLADVPPDFAVEPVHEWGERTISTYQVTMTSLGHRKIRAWYTLPKGTPPARGWTSIVILPSYDGNLVLPGFPARYGYATLSLFPRGKGESAHEWRLDQDVPKLLYNITDKNSYYYRGAYMDCVRGLDFLESRTEVDGGRLALWGASQGGGLTLATAALDDRPGIAIARLPWLCNFPEAANWTERPYDELHDYLAEHPDNRAAAMETLAYFDNLNLADSITCSTLVSAATIDPVHPYHTVFPVFEKIPALKSLVVYPGASGDEAGACNGDFNRHTMDWLERYLT